MGAKSNEMKHGCIIPFQGSKRKQLIEHEECQTLTMKFVIIGKTTTSNEQNCFWKYLDVLCELAENYLMVSEQEYGLGFCCSRERTGQLTVKHDNEPGDLKTTTTIDDKLKRLVVKLAPMFYESVFREKNRAGNVGASHQKAEKLDSEHVG